MPLFILLPFLSPLPQAKPPSDPIVFALLVSNHLVAVRGPTGAVISDHALAAAPVPTWRAFRGYYVALSKDQKSLYVLALSQPPARDELAVVDVATTRVERRYVLTRGIVFRSLAVGPVSGRIYLFGNRARDVVVTVLDPRTARRFRRGQCGEPMGCIG